MSPEDSSGDASPPRDSSGGGDSPPLPPAAPAPPEAPDRFATLLKGAVLGAFLAVAAAGVLRIQERVRSLDDFQVDLSRVRVEAPLWLPAAEAEALRERAAAGGKAPLMREGLPEFLAGRLESDPRVVRVVSARRIHPDAVEVVLRVRRPVALVEAGGSLLGVDARGIHVPGDYRTLTLPRIQGAGGDRPAPGLPFGPAVRAGASVAAALPRDLAAALGVTLLDVSGAGGPEGVVLRRAPVRGEVSTAIEWGRAPSSEEAVLDPAPAAKVARLRLAAERFPGLRGLRTVRLGFDDLVVVPL